MRPDPRLWLGFVLLIAPGTGYGAAALSRRPLLAECKPGEARVFPRVRVQAFDGRVLNGASEGKAPLVGLQIELRSLREEGSYYVLSDAEGRFSFAEVPQGGYVLTTCLDGWDALEVEVELRSTAKAVSCELVVSPSEAAGKREVRWTKRE